MKKKKTIRGRGTSKTTSKKKQTLHDSLAKSLADTINKQFEDFKAAHFLDGSEETKAATEVTEWISTGDDILDLRISNRPHGGIPAGKISEFFGGESSGKSLLLGHLIVETQKKGGVAVLIDTESSAQPEFLDAIGVDTSRLVYAQLETLEDAFLTAENIITKIRETDKDKLVLICIDSIAGATTKIEMEQEYDKEGYATAKALVMSKAMRKITNLIARQKIAFVCTNQVREKLNVMFGDKTTTSGGRALGFHSSVRLKLQKLAQIKLTKDGEPVGIKTKVKVDKNRIGPPLRTCEIEIYFNRGIDRYKSWITALKNKKLATVSGGRSPMVKIKSLDIELPTKKFGETMKSDAELKEKVYQLICDNYIMKYSNAEDELEDISIENEVEE